MSEDQIWRKCSSCKKPINYGQPYYECSVSTCNGKRTGFVFCSVSCWERHLPSARHKDAAAVEEKAPSRPAASQAASAPQRRIIASPKMATSTANDKDILIVASKLKAYIKQRSDMSTSADVMDVLSDIVRLHCDEAIDQARQAGRKTVLERDFKKTR